MSWFFACSYIVSRKLKVSLGMHVVKYGYDLLDPGTLKSALAIARINRWIELIFLHAGSDVVTFC